MRGFLQRFKKGDPVAKVCDTAHHNRVADILEDLTGVGVRIEKNTDGSAWRIINDGTSDESPPPGSGVGETSFPWGDQFVFGLKRTAKNKITVVNCKARRFGDPQGSSIYYTCSNVEVTFAGNGTGQKICWSWSPTAGLAILASPQTNDPLDDSDYIYGVVAVFDVAAGVATMATGGVIQAGHLLVLPVFTVAGT